MAAPTQASATDADGVVLVTGASGFLGAHVVAAAARLGVDAVGAVRAQSDTSRLFRLAPRAKTVELDLTASAESLAEQLCELSPSAVIHCAAYGVDYRQNDFETAVQINIVGTTRLLQAAARSKSRFVHVGTAYEYGTLAGEISEDVPLKPRGLYGVTKAAAAMAVLDRGAALNVPSAIARLFAMYGPEESEHKFVPMVMRAIANGQEVELTAGEQRRDYVYVGDVAAALVQMARRPVFPDGEVLNLGAGQSRLISLRELGDAACRAVNGDPALLNWGARPYRVDEMMEVVSCSVKAEKLLGWAPATSLKDGMALTASAGGYECL